MEKQQPQRVSLTPDMIKSFKTLTCTCGGMLFHSGVVFKKISPLISPSGKEEIYPLEVVICQNCGKVPRDFNNPDVLPEEVLSQKIPESAKFEFPKTQKPFSVVKDETKDYADQPTKDELS